MNHQTSNRMSTRSSAGALHAAFALLPLSLLAVAGCAADELSVGSDEAPLDPEQGNRCGNGVLSGSVETTTQSEIDALAGCEEVTGDLTLLAFPGMDLTPLSELRIVRGNLTVDGTGGFQELLESLAGLEGVQQVNALLLQSIYTPDLSGLRGLTRVNWDPLGPHSTGGSITIVACHRLRDLTGLENLTDWNTLQVAVHDELRSLNGLRAPSVLRDVYLQDNPQLKDLSALAAVDTVESFGLQNSAVESIDGFQLRVAGSLVIRNNPALVHLDGLNELKTIEFFNVENNEQLDHLPELPELREIQFIEIIGNAELRAVPSYSGSTSTGASAGDPDFFIPVRFGAGLFHIAHNPKLTSIGSASYDIWRSVAIWSNASLTELDLGSLRATDSLVIRDNAVLSTLQIPVLSRVDDLHVVDNPLLATVSFANVESYTRELSGNLDDAAP